MTIEEHVALSRFTTLGTGGPARWFARPETERELAEALASPPTAASACTRSGWARTSSSRTTASTALVLKLAGELAAAETRGELLVCGGGAPNAVALHRARAAGLGGFEFACAIPGTAGGGVWMNAGAYGGDWRAIMARAHVVSADGAGWLTPDEPRHVVPPLRPRPRPGRGARRVPSPPARPGRDQGRGRELNATRKAAQPTNRRTFGSVFKNPEHELTAGRMLEACGLKGYRVGGAQISPKHANFIENAGARARRRRSP